MKKIRVLVVDDSAFMRKALTSFLESDNEIEIVGIARNGRDGVEMAALLKPDIITMDIEMPIMNGIEALKQIMATNPIPVIMVSSLTTEGAKETMNAMALGAVDFIPKDFTRVTQQSELLRSELLGKIKEIAQSQSIRTKITKPIASYQYVKVTPAKSDSDKKSVSFPSSPASTSEQKILSLSERIALRRSNPSVAGLPNFTQPVAQESKIIGSNQKVSIKKRPEANFFKLIVLGVSTGGPLALHNLIPRLPANLPVPILIVQHMPPFFTKSLSDRLNVLSHIQVVEAQDKDILKPGTVYIAPGGMHMLVSKDGKSISITSEPSNTLHKPSVDVMINSAIDRFGANILGIIMTGMGKDGAAALKRLHDQGGYVLAQTEESCIVYGMPKAVVDDGSANELHSLDNLSEAISSCLGLHAVDPKVER